MSIRTVHAEENHEAEIEYWLITEEEEQANFLFICLFIVILVTVLANAQSRSTRLRIGWKDASVLHS